MRRIALVSQMQQARYAARDSSDKSHETTANLDLDCTSDKMNDIRHMLRSHPDLSDVLWMYFSGIDLFSSRKFESNYYQVETNN